MSKKLVAYFSASGKASDCIRCEACEKHCPQKLTISEHMKNIAKRFE